MVNAASAAPAPGLRIFTGWGSVCRWRHGRQCCVGWHRLKHRNLLHLHLHGWVCVLPTRCRCLFGTAGLVLNEETGHIIGIGKATYNRLGEAVRTSVPNSIEPYSLPVHGKETCGRAACSQIPVAVASGGACGLVSCLRNFEMQGNAMKHSALLLCFLIC